MEGETLWAGHEGPDDVVYESLLKDQVEEVG